MLRRGYELGAFGGIVIGLPLLMRKRRASLENAASPLLTAALRRLGITSISCAAATGEARLQSCFWLNGLTVHPLPSALAADLPVGCMSLGSLQLHYNIPRVSDAENVCSQYQLRISGQACLLCKYTIGLGIMHRYGAFQVLVWCLW